MNNDTIENDAFDDIIDSLDCLKDADSLDTSDIDLQFDQSKTRNTEPLDSSLLGELPLGHYDTDSDVMIDDKTANNMTVSSSLMDSIVSGTIESIAMLSMGPGDNAEEAMKGQKEEHQPYQLVHEGNSKCVYHQSDPMNKFGGQTSAVAIKVSTDQFPDVDQISRLEKEYKISKILASKCRAVRAALHLSGGVESDLNSYGNRALYLEWVPGITLRDWARLQRRPACYESATDDIDNDSHNNWKKTYFSSAIQVALNIAKSLAEIHEVGGAVINNLSAENIILNTNDDEIEKASIYIIGLGSASLFQATPQLSREEKYLSISNDLRALGEVFFELFSGESPHRKISNNHGNIVQPSKDGERLSSLNSSSSNRDGCLTYRDLKTILTLSSVPSQIAVLVLDLMEAFVSNDSKSSNTPFLSNEQYQSVREIENELHAMCTDLDSTLVNTGAGCLQFNPGKLYGREQQHIELINIFTRVTMLGKAHELVVVSGLSGVGKTALVKEVFHQPLIEKGGHFLHVKFDQLNQGQPFAAIVDAFSKLCDNLVNGDTDELSPILYTFQEKADTELLGVLTSIIPALRKIVGDESSLSNIKLDGWMARNQFMFAFQQFVKAVAKPTSPLIIFLDDLQWTDKASLELVHALVIDPEIKSFLAIECYRSNEIMQDHPLTDHLNEIRKTMAVLTEIRVENMETGDVNALLSDTIRKQYNKTKSLTNIIYCKTSGNVLLVIQFIKSIWDNGLLRYSSRLKTWNWDEEAIESKCILDDAANLMAQTISLLPADTKHVLKQMSCLGFQCEESILCKILNQRADEGRNVTSEKDTLHCMLDIAICKGLVEKVDSKYRFTHDQIQHAAYSQIPKKDRELWHAMIGQQILKQSCRNDMEKALFLIVDQLNRGKGLIKNEAGLINLAELNCLAGEKAMSLTSFSSAVSYLKAGISILEEKHLKMDHELCIKMYVLSAESEYCIGNFIEMEKALNFVLTEAECLDEKLSAYATLVHALAAQNKMYEAIEIGLDVLAQLGEEFPNNPDNSDVMKDYLKTKKMLEGINFTDLLKHRSVGKRIEFIMEMLESLTFYSHLSNQMLMPLLSFRIVQLSICHGTCVSTPFGLASYSGILCTRLDDVGGGNSYGILAMDILEHLKAYHKLARVITVLHSTVFIWRKPLRFLLEPYLDAYHTGMKVGDNQYALCNAAEYCIVAFLSGKELSSIKNCIDDFGNKMKQYKQDALLKLFLPLKIAINTLMGDGGKPVLLDGVEITFDVLLKGATEKKYRQEVCKIHYYQMLIACFFDNHELAGQVLKLRNNISECICRRPEGCNGNTFYDGLMLVNLAKKTKEERWVVLFNKVIEKIRKRAEHAPCNAKHKVLLLEAEYCSLVKEDDRARTKYDEAVALAGENGFIQEQALAYEKAGVHYLDRGNESRASHYLGKAHNAYLEWGAKGKAHHLCTCYPL